MDAMGNMQSIKALVPLAEMQTYSTELRSLTGGEGTYSATESHFDVVPPNVAQEVMARYQREKESE
jgi:elongation factor G